MNNFDKYLLILSWSLESTSHSRYGFADLIKVVKKVSESLMSMSTLHSCVSYLPQLHCAPPANI